ncbi:unnamed protein product [Aureobasidium pullulans]|nr:unnamed protein product [Aureobasidium pullulans]
MKSDKGGLYPKVQPAVVPAASTAVESAPEKKLVVLDMGLGQPLAGKGPAEIVYSGRLLEVSLDGKIQRVISKNLPLPDGVDFCDNKLYYTNMGIPSQNDGSVVSVNLDGTGSTTIIPPGKIYTPKQISIDQIAKSSTLPIEKAVGYGAATQTAQISRSSSIQTHCLQNELLPATS